MVDHGPVLFHLLCAPVTFYSVYFVYRQNRRFRHPFLQPYLYYVVFDGLGSLADVFFRILPVQLDVSGRVQGAFSPLIGLILNLFALPIQALMIFFFVAAAGKLLGFAFNRRLAASLWVGYAAIFILTLAGVMRYVNGGSIAWLRPLMWVAATITTLYMAGTLVCGLKFVLKEKERDRRKFFWVFTLVYLAGFAFQNALMFTSMAGVWVTFLVLGVHLPVLAFLPGFLSRNAAAALPNGPAATDLNPFYEAKGISRREREIIAYLVQGLSNREIEQKLHISRRTVENHVYNIYRKLGVGNRVQLVNGLESARPVGKRRL